MSRSTISTDAGYEIKLPLDIPGYKVLRNIGRGLSSVVFLVESIPYEQIYAAKVIPRESFKSEGFMELLERELRLLQTINHPNIVKVADTIFTKELIIVIMEDAGEDLISFTDKNYPIPMTTIQDIFSQLVTAVSYMHSRGIVHRDLKPDNILISAGGHLKICDFGLCQETRGTNRLFDTLCGTVMYTPPEVLNGKQYDGTKVDVWAIGIVLFSMLTRSLPWNSDNVTLMMRSIKTASYVMPSYVPQLPANIIRSCLKVDPNERPSADELLTNPWVQMTVQFIGESRSQPRTSYSAGTLLIKPLAIQKSNPFPKRQRPRIITRPSIVSFPSLKQ